MITAIYTVNHTTLTIETREGVDLEQMGREGDPIKLAPGVHHVFVDCGVYKILSTTRVNVTADNPECEVTATLSNKDGPPPEPSRLPNPDPVAVWRFFSDAKRFPAPR